MPYSPPNPAKSLCGSIVSNSRVQSRSSSEQISAPLQPSERMRFTNQATSHSAIDREIDQEMPPEQCKTGLSFFNDVSSESLDSTAGYIDHRCQADLQLSRSIFNQNEFLTKIKQNNENKEKTVFTESPESISPKEYPSSLKECAKSGPSETTPLIAQSSSYQAIRFPSMPSPKNRNRISGSLPNVSNFTPKQQRTFNNGYHRLTQDIEEDSQPESSVNVFDPCLVTGTYELTSTIASRRPSLKAEEDVCFPMNMEVVDAGSKSPGVLGSQYVARDQDGINYDELEAYMEEEMEKMTAEMIVTGNYEIERERRLSEVESNVLGNHYSRRPLETRSLSADILTKKEIRPYRFTFFSGGLPSSIHARSLSEIPTKGQTFNDLMNIGQPFWLDVLSPTDDEMRVLSKTFGIHPLTTEDIQMEESREKIELFRSYYFVCFRSFDQDPSSPTYLEPLNMYAVVFRSGLLTFHFRPTSHPTNVRRRIRQLKDYITVTSDWISYALIDDITDAFGPLIRKIELEVDSIDELTLLIKEGSQCDMLTRIGTVRKKVMGILRLIGGKADVIKGLSKRCNEQWEIAPRSEIGMYLGDIQDHLVTMRESLTHFEKILSRSHSNYLAQISIDMTQVNNQTNDVLSRLTVLGTILIPMNLVTGLWGMNVQVPGQDKDGLAWFFSIAGAMFAFALLCGLLAHRYFGIL